MKRFTKSFLMLIATFFILSSAISVEAKGKDVITNGVFIGNVDVSGLTKEEARTQVEAYVESLYDLEVKLNAVDDSQLTVTAGELGIQWNNQSVLIEAENLGKKGNLIKRYKELKDLSHNNKVYPVQFSIDEEAVTEYLTEKSSKINREPIDTSLTRSNGAFVIQEGQTGLVISVEESVKAIADYMNDEWTKTDDEINLVVEEKKPRGMEEDLLKVKDLLGSFTTSYRTSSKARSGNVSNGAELINGTTLYPGDQFSTYEVVSPFSEANGYFMAGSYLNGMVVDSLGGGICQVSTTLYNAVLRAELEVVERSNHSMIVSYVDPSADAAIAGTYKDFKFVNNTDTPIYIEGITTSDKQITFNIYGMEYRSTNRTVTYESEVLSRTDPGPERIIQDASKPVGFIDVQSAHVGYKAKLWKVVRENGEIVSKEQVNTSSYMASPRTATVGVASPDPNVVNAMHQAIGSGSIDHVKGVVAAFNAAQAQALKDAQNAANTTPQGEEQ